MPWIPSLVKLIRQTYVGMAMYPSNRWWGQLLADRLAPPIALWAARVRLFGPANLCPTTSAPSDARRRSWSPDAVDTGMFNIYPGEVREPGRLVLEGQARV